MQRLPGTSIFRRSRRAAASSRPDARTRHRDGGVISYWIYGVNPGGMAQNGDDLKSAYANFRRGVRDILCDLAKRASDFAEFREEVESFRSGTNRDRVEEWVEARRKIQAGPVPEVGLLTETADLDPQVTIRNLLDASMAESLRINELPDRQEQLAA